MPWGRHAAMAVQRATGHIGDPLNISPFPQTVAVEGMGARKGCHRPKLLGQRLKANAAIGYFDWRDRRRSLGECPRIWRCWRWRDNSGVLGVSGQSGCTAAPSAGTATPGLRGAAAKGGAGGAAAEAGAAAKGAAAKGADGSGTGALADICCCCCNISPTLPEAACAAAASRNFCPRLGFSLIIQASDHPCSTATDSTWWSLRFKGTWKELMPWTHSYTMPPLASFLEGQQRSARSGSWFLRRWQKDQWREWMAMIKFKYINDIKFQISSEVYCRHTNLDNASCSLTWENVKLMHPLQLQAKQLSSVSFWPGFRRLQM